MTAGTILLIIALALIIGAVILGIFNHPWLALLLIGCLALLKVTTGTPKDPH